MRVLIIGGTRFTGPFVVRRLANMGHQVAVFHRGECETELPGSVEHIHGARKDLELFQAQFKTFAPDVVIDMIAFTEDDAVQLVKVFKGIARRLVVISSVDVYSAYDHLRRVTTGAPAATPLSESAPLRQKLYPYFDPKKPADAMSRYEKILVEKTVMGQADIPGTVLRLPAVYGPNDRQHRIFPYLKRMDDNRSAILLETKQADWRWTRGYVENVADAIALAATDARAQNQIYNVGEERALSEAEWVAAIARAAGWNGNVARLAAEQLPAALRAEMDWAHHLDADTGKIRRELGYKELVNREDGLARTVAWERTHPPAKINAVEFDYASEDKVLMQFANN